MWLPYLGAVSAASIAIVIRVVLNPQLGTELPFITLFPAIFASAYFFGLGPTLVATLAGVAAALTLFVDPRQPQAFGGQIAVLGTLVFTLTGIAVGWLGDARLRAERSAGAALARAVSEADRAEQETIRAEEEAARAEEEAARAEEEMLRAGEAARRAEHEGDRAAREAERVERVLSSIADAFISVNHQWVVTYVNRQAAAIYGRPPSEYVGRILWEAFPRNTDGPFDAMYRRAMAGQQVLRSQAYHPALGKWLLVTAYPSEDGLSIIAQDVTESVRGREANEKLAAIVESSADAIVAKQLDGTVTSWNPAAERIFQYTADEMIGRSIYTLIPPELHEDERRVLARLAKGEPVEFSETERIRKDGARITIALSVSPIRDADGNVTGASSIKRDITAARRVQAALVAESARSRELAQVLDLAQALVRDLDGRITYWSSGAARLYGYPAAEAVGRSARDLLQTQYPAPAEDVHGALLARDHWEGELSNTARDGRRMTIAAQWVLRRSEAGEPLGVFEVHTDETARREIEERARQNERLEVVGQLAGGVAHEANNQMTVVLGAAEFLLKRSELAEAARADIEHIRAAAERTAAITGQLLAFSRRQVLQPRVLDLDETVRGLEPVLRRTLGERSTLTLRLRAGAGPVKADPGQLAQVLLNFTLNSRDAMPMGGHLAIETDLLELTEDYARHHPGTEIRPGPYALVAVSDTGHGMSRETAAHVFEPFYTTKPVGKGTGLGLATVYGIVKQSGGYVWGYSELGKGTTFKVYLPLSSEASVLPAKPPRPPRASGELVLLVEDEPAVRQMAARTLQEYGYGVLEASGGHEALEVLSRADGQVSVLVTDVVMPRMDGPELARRALALKPALPVLFMSGYTDDEIVRRGLLDRSEPFLQKPFTPEALGEQVAALLKSRAHGAK
ncbi:MAG TPA: PAS domain S-box protein [Gemmatimonadales bacterium]|nr:PAS domain S-box protein [Gemmatimonadales bacterium]